MSCRVISLMKLEQIAQSAGLVAALLPALVQ
jgi:hypothetical protein